MPVLMELKSWMLETLAQLSAKLPMALAIGLTNFVDDGTIDVARGHGQNTPMRIKLIEDLPMATSAELYQLSWVIEQLLADPRRIVLVRAQLHTGQQVQYLHWADGKLRSARVVGMHGDHVGVLDAASNKSFKVHYAAILTDPTVSPTHSGETSTNVEFNKPAPPPEVAGRADFRVGNRVTFIDKNLEHRVGLIVRVNQHTATLDCDGQKWRVAFELLRHLVDV